MPEVAFPEGYQRALVTGATSGIGKAIVLALRDAGLQVIAVGRSPQALAELAGEPGVTTLQTDVRDYRSLAAALEGQAVDVLVNNAGILSTRAAFQDIDEAEIDNMLDINLKATAAPGAPGVAGHGRAGQGASVFHRFQC